MSKREGEYLFFPDLCVNSVCMITVKSGCAMSGLIADSRTMVDKARVHAQVLKEAFVCDLRLQREVAVVFETYSS